MRVAITGANGDIGRTVAPYLAARHEVRLATWDLPAGRAAAMPDCPGAQVRRVDVTDGEAVTEFVRGMDAVIHLAGQREVAAEWTSLRALNIDGTFNVFDACRSEAVSKIVFASSNHAAGGYELDGQSGLDGSEVVRPDSLYGVTKIFGEALGRYLSDRHGISVICLRIGSFLHAPDSQRSLRTWLSPGDLCRLVSAALAADVRYGVYYGASANTPGQWDIGPAIAELGYDPQDDAALFVEHVK
jgi:NAD+ dependent glucose-6-phosphate dehydrogenase